VDVGDLVVRGTGGAKMSCMNTINDTRIRRAIERNRELYRRDPVGFGKETGEMNPLPDRDAPPVYPWGEDADERERSLVERRTLLEAVKRIGEGKRAFPD
jgi:hypothetical protein